MPPPEGTITAARMLGNQGNVSVKLDAPPTGFEVTGLARLGRHDATGFPLHGALRANSDSCWPARNETARVGE